MVRQKPKIMSGRNAILTAVKTNQPAPKALPVLDFESLLQPDDLYSGFRKMVESVGGRVLELPGMEALTAMIESSRNAQRMVINQVPEAGAMDGLPSEPAALANVHQAYIAGVLGVAENGAVWVPESAMGERALPFICLELVLVVRKSSLVPTMHHAYEALTVQQEGFGVFIAGPSKTADIEQSLVIGAHGPKALTVVIIP
jgi:L-lactate dehydrogenase complex protein LldG